jgi:hypothetical protein
MEGPEGRSSLTPKDATEWVFRPHEISKTMRRLPLGRRRGLGCAMDCTEKINERK